MDEEKVKEKSMQIYLDVCRAINHYAPIRKAESAKKIIAEGLVSFALEVAQNKEAK